MIRDGFPLVLTGSFDASSWDPVVSNDFSAFLFSGNHNESLQLPRWVLSNATFEPFDQPIVIDTSGNASLTSYTAATKGFFSTLECEKGDFKSHTKANASVDSSIKANIVSESCNVDFDLDLVDPTQANKIARWPQRNLVGQASPVSCANNEKRYLFLVTLANSNLDIIASRSVA